MSLKETLNNDIKDAMRAKDQVALLALRAIKAAIMVIETSEGRNGAELTAEEELQVVIKQSKQRKDSIEQFRKNGRDELADKEEAELRFIEKYLPKQISSEELDEILKGIIAEVGATSPKDMGKVIGAANKRLQGQADGKLIAERVKALLS